MTRTSVPTLVLLDEEARRIYDAESKSRGLSLSAFFRDHAREIVRLRADPEGAAFVVVLGVLALVVAGIAAAVLLGPLQIGTGADRTLALTIKDRTSGALADDVPIWIYWYGAPGIIAQGRAVAGHAIFFGLPRDIVSLTWGCGRWQCEDAGRVVDLAPGNVDLELTVHPCVGETCAPAGSSGRPAFVPSVDTTGGDTIPAGNFDTCDTVAGGTPGE